MDRQKGKTHHQYLVTEVILRDSFMTLLILVIERIGEFTTRGTEDVLRKRPSITWSYLIENFYV